MRATAFAAFILIALGAGGVARANPASAVPRVSLALAIDWSMPSTSSKLAVTSAAPTAAQHDVAAYGRFADLARQVVVPHYVEPDVTRQQMFHQVYVTPFTPYVGAYGLNLTVESDALLH
jgi:hypothetical protein